MKTIPSYTLGNYIGTLLFSVTNAHIFHLKTTSFAKHKALDDYYNEFPEVIDKLAEKIQSDEIISGYQDYSSYLYYIKPEQDFDLFDYPLMYFKNLREFTCNGREVLFDSQNQTALWSLTDDVINAIDEVIYKLSKLS